jgi:hypothetical protein
MAVLQESAETVSIIVASANKVDSQLSYLRVHRESGMPSKIYHFVATGRIVALAKAPIGMLAVSEAGWLYEVRNRHRFCPNSHR